MARADLGWIMLLGVGLRLPYLKSRPLWQDEALQYHLSSRESLLQLAQSVAAQDLHPPAHSALLALFTGGPPWAIRIPSWIAGVATIGLAYRFGNALGGRASARSAALLAAVMPAWVAYSREARPYAVSIFLLMGLYVLLAERQERPVLRTATAALCGAWQYMVAALALIPLCFAYARDPARWRWPLAACVLTTTLQAVWFLPTQWPRGGDLATRLAPSLGLDSLALGLPSLFGYPLVGASSPWTVPLGAAVIGAAVAYPHRTRTVHYWAWASLSVGALLAALGVHPFGATRTCLALTVPVFIVVLTMYASQRVPVQAALAMVLAGVAWARAPGVPVEDVPALIALPHLTTGKVAVHASAHKALSLYAPHVPIEHVVPWGCVRDDLPQGPGWLVVSGSPPCLRPFIEGWSVLPWSTPLKGVRVYETPLSGRP